MNSCQVIRCVAIDDEPLALEVIRKFCQRLGGMELVTFSNPKEGLAYIMDKRPDLAFLDIEMENVTGIAIASQLPPETCFIFTTAYLNYAMDGFELDAVDYLHKPFAFSRFETACRKAMRRILPVEQHKPSERSIVVKQEYNNVTIALSDILYIMAMEGYVKIYRENGVCTVSRVILKNIGRQLPESEFLRIHRSFIVSRSKIKSFNKREVELISGVVLPIGRQYAADVAALLS